jgi:hypothetical protein
MKQFPVPCTYKKKVLKAKKHAVYQIQQLQVFTSP